MADEVKRWLPDLYRMAEKMPEHGNSASFVESRHYDAAIAERDRLARELAAWKRAVREESNLGVLYGLVERRVAELMKGSEDGG